MNRYKKMWKELKKNIINIVKKNEVTIFSQSLLDQMNAFEVEHKSKLPKKSKYSVLCKTTKQARVVTNYWGIDDDIANVDMRTGWNKGRWIYFNKNSEEKWTWVWECESRFLNKKQYSFKEFCKLAGIKGDK